MTAKNTQEDRYNKRHASLLNDRLRTPLPSIHPFYGNAHLNTGHGGEPEVAAELGASDATLSPHPDVFASPICCVIIVLVATSRVPVRGATTSTALSPHPDIFASPGTALSLSIRTLSRVPVRGVDTSTPLSFTQIVSLHRELALPSLPESAQG